MKLSKEELCFLVGTLVIEQCKVNSYKINDKEAEKKRIETLEKIQKLKVKLISMIYGGKVK